MELKAMGQAINKTVTIGEEDAHHRCIPCIAARS